MTINSTYSKILLTVFSLSFIVWFGANTAKNSIAFDLFETVEEFQLRQDLSDEEYYWGIYHFTTISSYTTVSYSIAFLTLMLLAIYYRKILKIRGWLFISIALFFLSSPVNLLLIYFDIKLSIALHWEGIRDIKNNVVTEYFADRFTNVTLSALSGLAFLSSLTSVLFLIWRPLDKLARSEEGKQ